MRRPRIAFIDISFHKRTQSSAFLVSELRRHADVYRFWDNGTLCDSSEEILLELSSYDCLVIFQWSSLLKNHSESLAALPNVVFVPMYDHVIGSAAPWGNYFRYFKVLCFSSALYQYATLFTNRVALFSWYPPVVQEVPPRPKDDIRVFFWQRVSSINLGTLDRVLSGSQLDVLTLHGPPDPGQEEQTENAFARLSVIEERRAGWFASRQDYISLLATHSIFFAPRLIEGIGLAFLEAMALGLCVIASDQPTHNEYITQMRTGILYNDSTAGCDLSRAVEIGRAARHSIREGRRQWIGSRSKLLAFCLEL